MKLGHKGHLKTRIKFLEAFFLSPKISLSILNELKKPRFQGIQEKSVKSKGLEPWIHSKDRGR
jgi:hypothetical protein